MILSLTFEIYLHLIFMSKRFFDWNYPIGFSHLHYPDVVIDVKVVGFGITNDLVFIEIIFKIISQKFSLDLQRFPALTVHSLKKVYPI